MTKTSQYKNLEERILKSIKTVYDPDISVNIYDLGLIYKIDINEDNSVKVTMTLTSPSPSFLVIKKHSYNGLIYSHKRASFLSPKSQYNHPFEIARITFPAFHPF